MDDVIYRQEAIKEIIETYEYEFPTASGAFDEFATKIVPNVLKNLPSAQKKGHWRNYEGTLTCSICETEIDNGIMEYCGDDVPMFCPYCGADMRGDDDG